MKRVLFWLVIAFVVWWIMTAPDGAAAVVHNVGHLGTQAATGVSKFLTTATSK